jgi:nicotinamidase-related amidase
MRHPLPLLTHEVAVFELDRAHTALLVQDLHAPFLDWEGGPLAREARRRGVTREFDEFVAALPDVIAACARVLVAVRDLGLPVHHVRLATPAGGAASSLQQALGWTWDDHAPEAAFDPRLAPLAGEQVHAKPGWGALGSASLREAFRVGGVRRVILMGLPLDFGIRHSCYELADAGYRTLLVSDATAALTAAAEAPARGNLSHGVTKSRSSGELLDLLARLRAQGMVSV